MNWTQVPLHLVEGTSLVLLTDKPTAGPHSGVMNLDSVTRHRKRNFHLDPVLVALLDPGKHVVDVTSLVLPNRDGEDPNVT